MHRSTRVVVLMGTMAFLCLVTALHGEDKQDSTTADQIAWGKVVDGLQFGILPDTGADGRPTTLFDGSTLRVNVQVRNAGGSTVRFLPSTFFCAAMGSGAAIPVTKLILTPSQGGEPISITYQHHNHLSAKQLDADDLEYYTTELAPGQALDRGHLVEFTPGKDRTTSWQRTGKSNLVPEGKYELKAVFVVYRQDSPWKGELTSGSLDVDLHHTDKH